MTRLNNLYIGSSGQLAVMAEFLARGYNAAIPQVDVGDDILVVRDSDGDVSRIQVKTANANVGKGSYSASFNVGKDQLTTPQTPDLSYVFVVRSNECWSDFIVIRREELDRLHSTQGVGSGAGDNIMFRLGFRRTTVAGAHTTLVTCNKQDLSTLRNNSSARALAAPSPMPATARNRWGLCPRTRAQARPPTKSSRPTAAKTAPLPITPLLAVHWPAEGPRHASHAKVHPPHAGGRHPLQRHAATVAVHPRRQQSRQ